MPFVLRHARELQVPPQFSVPPDWIPIPITRISESFAGFTCGRRVQLSRLGLNGTWDTWFPSDYSHDRLQPVLPSAAKRPSEYVQPDVVRGIGEP